jgi:hypothetical protein
MIEKPIPPMRRSKAPGNGERKVRIQEVRVLEII